MHETLQSGRTGLQRLNDTYGQRPAEAIIAAIATEAWPGRVAALSSFGADSAVLLHLISVAAPDLPVMFLQTGKHFAETLEYRETLAERFGLTNVIDLKPRPADLRDGDRFGRLWESDPDACCRLRKVQPLADALSGFDTTVTGRRRHQAERRAGLKVFERDGRRMRVNPLAGWSQDDVDAYAAAHALPVHPLVASGFRSIGCAPCTSATEAGEDARAGRWRGQTKVECGIHRRAPH